MLCLVLKGYVEFLEFAFVLDYGEDSVFKEKQDPSSLAYNKFANSGFCDIILDVFLLMNGNFATRVRDYLGPVTHSHQCEYTTGVYYALVLNLF